MKTITNFGFDNTDLPKNETVRYFYVYGDVDSVFSVYITNEVHEETTTNKGAVGHYYDFDSQEFVASGFKGLLQVKIPTSGIYIGSIKFPTVTDNDEYNIYLRAETHFNTQLSTNLVDKGFLYKMPNFSKQTNSDGSLTYPSTVYQYLDTTVTIAVLSGNAGIVEPSTTTYAASRGVFQLDESNIEVISPINRKAVSYSISTGDASLVLSILKQPEANDFYITKTSGTVYNDQQPADTAGTGSLIYNYLDVNSVEGLAVGYDVFSGVNASGAALSLEAGVYKIVAIKTHEELRALGGQYISNLVDGVTRIFFNTTSGFPNTEQNSVLTFRGYGPNAAFKSYNTKFKLNKLSAALPVVNNADTGQPTEFNVVTTAGQDLTSADSTTWEVASTAGIKVGNTMQSKGLGVTSAGASITVAAVANATTITTSGALASGYTILNGTAIYFTGSAATVTISGNIDFINLGDTNFTLTLDLDKILTLTDNY
tara:strand:- start:957 stop:2408 length:1452 start_codon:yes stop_codon:yes gene_type:complete